jgi:ankyrin repeat protein
MASFGVVSLPALHQACRDGDSNTLAALINTSIVDRLELFRRVCECDSYLGWTPAHWAAYHGKVRFLFSINV